MEHDEERCTVCSACYAKDPESSLTSCRQNKKHQQPNATAQYPVSLGTHKNLPQCCEELWGLQVQCTLEENGGQGVADMYVTGYMIPFTEEKRDMWMKKLSNQTGIEYTVQNGRHTNLSSREKGVANIDGKLQAYVVRSSQVYRCKRAGKGRGKRPPLSTSTKHRVHPGTRKLGCKASVQTKTLELGNGQQILQVNVPTTAAHLPAHNVGSLADQLTLKPLQEVKDKVGELVRDTFLTSKALKISLKAWVQKELIPRHIAEGIIAEAPSVLNRAYHPTNDDICVISRNAIIEERNAKFDQDAVLCLLESEKKTTGLDYYLRQYKNKERYVSDVNLQVHKIHY